MKFLPYFRWYPADAETDEIYFSFTDQELGFYHRCLNRSWINDGLPSEMNTLAKAMGVTRKYLDRLWPAVSKAFVLTETVVPRYVNLRQEEERELARTKSKQASDAVSVRERLKRSRSSDDTSDDHLRAQACADSVSVYESSVIGKGVPGENRQSSWKTDEQYVRFVADYLGTGAALIDADFLEAWQYVWCVLLFEQKLERVAALNRHAEEYRSDPRFVPKPRKFLESEWSRPVRPAPRSMKPASLADRTMALMERRIANGEEPL